MGKTEEFKVLDALKLSYDEECYIVGTNEDVVQNLVDNFRKLIINIERWKRRFGAQVIRCATMQSGRAAAPYSHNSAPKAEADYVWGREWYCGSVLCNVLRMN
ncbi:hypothetical protein OWV82_010537 [Melia azedarach]|uniref:Uncharacterized protein n=1 Tax=Melia azedarach TaxID=155640 RepID=A0ACC1Y698_MELAZ|nr:hypothetical protein OWV82_010537 [Melia azedarach]